MNLCVIPARGGSKRIPRKNIKEFCGKPMIAWSIETALNSECFDEVIVSTDDAEIADIALSYGVKVPFTRPPHLSDDFATTADVMQHATQFYLQQQKQIDYICCIYATAPFIQIEDLKKGLDKLQNNPNLSYVFSATEYVFPIQRAIKLIDDKVAMFDETMFSIRSQDLEKAWHDAGQFYWGQTEAWNNKTRIFAEHSSIVELPHYRVQDIDTFDDWELATFKFKFLQER